MAYGATFYGIPSYFLLFALLKSLSIPSLSTHGGAHPFLPDYGFILWTAFNIWENVKLSGLFCQHGR